LCTTLTELVPSSVSPDPDLPDSAVISERDDRDDSVVSPTSTDLVPSQRIQLQTNNVHDSSPSLLSDTVADIDWGDEEYAPPTSELERDFREHMSNIPNYHMVWNDFRAASTIRYINGVDL